MIDEQFKIYVEQLRDGQIERLAETFSPEVLDVHDKDLQFVDPIKLEGKAYLADDMLVLHLDADTLATIPCRMCNEPVKVGVAVKGSYHAVPLDEIKTGIFDFHETLREIILLEVPPLVECHQGKCPQRDAMQKFFKKEDDLGVVNGEEGYHPFADLDLELKKAKK